MGTLRLCRVRIRPLSQVTNLPAYRRRYRQVIQRRSQVVSRLWNLRVSLPMYRRRSLVASQRENPARSRLRNRLMYRLLNRLLGRQVSPQ